MANRLQHLRGSEAEHSTFTGAKGEISLVTDTSANRIPTGEVRVHDGTTAGGLHVTGAARAWVNFNGTLDENSGSLTTGENALIRASYNVSSVYFNGTGDYTVNFATAMPDVNYVVTSIGSAGASQSVRTPTVVDGNTKSTTSLQIQYQRYDSLLSDQPNCFFAIFR